MTRSAGTAHPGVAVRTARPADLPGIARIYNQGIRERIATFETREREPEELRAWLDDPHHPLLVAVDAPAPPAADAPPAEVLGWVAASGYRPRACYDGIGEFSVYVDRAARGRGVGHALIDAFLPACAGAGLWKVLSRVFPENHASRRLLAAHGFREVGVYQRHARLDGVWKDVVIVERLLDDDASGRAASGRTDGETDGERDGESAGEPARRDQDSSGSGASAPSSSSPS